MRSRILLICAAALLLSACRSMTEYEPIVDTQGGDMSRYEDDLRECREYGEQVQVGQRTASGAAGGAVMGGIFGGIFGNSRTAGRTAGAGGVGGGVSGATNAYGERALVIRNCLIGRGYRVLN